MRQPDRAHHEIGQAMDNQAAASGNPLFQCFWPEGYGLLPGAALILFAFLFAFPVAFIILCSEVGPREAWRSLI